MGRGAAQSTGDGIEDWTLALEGTPFRAVSLIGRGGMGIVVEAEHRSLRTRSAVKLLHRHLVADAQLVERLRFEAQTLARLSHPHLVQVTDLGTTHDGRPFYVMERLRGRTLHEVLAGQGALDVVSACAIVCAVLDALGAAHAKGIVHRDVKPENVFLTEDGGVRLLDFGIAKTIASKGDTVSRGAPSFETREGVILGTPLYVTPEQILGEAIAPATDVYAVGLVLFRMITGRHPFEGLARDALFRAVLEKAPPRASQLASQDVPRHVDEALARALAKDPEHRHASAAAFIAALRDAQVASDLPRQSSSMPAQLTSADVTVALARPERAWIAAVPAPRHEPPIAHAHFPRGREISRAGRPLGLVCLLVALASLGIRAYGIVTCTEVFLDPAAELARAFPGVAADAMSVVRVGAAFALARHLMLFVSSSLLALVAVELVRGGPRALFGLGVWRWLGALSLLVAVPLDVLVISPSQVELVTRMSAKGEGTVGLSAAFVYAMSLAAASCELAVLIVVHVGRRALLRASAEAARR